MSSERRIRVGVTLDGRRVPRWKRDVLHGLLEAEGVDLALVVLTAPERAPDRGAAGALLRLYRALDRRVFAGDPDPVAIVDVSTELAAIPTVDHRKGRHQDGGGDAARRRHRAGRRARRAAERGTPRRLDLPLRRGARAARRRPLPARHPRGPVRQPRRARAPVRPGAARQLDRADRPRLAPAGARGGAAALPAPRGPLPARAVAAASSPPRAPRRSRRSPASRLDRPSVRALLGTLARIAVAAGQAPPAQRALA